MNRGRPGATPRNTRRGTARGFLAAALLGFAVASSAGCTNLGTGGTLVRFHAYAAGLEGVDGSTAFDTSAGFHVTLTQARLHVGAVYFRLGQTNPGSASASCYGDTTYGLEVPGPVDADVLSEQLQEFSVLGDATGDLNQSAEIWLTGGSIDDVTDAVPIVRAAGTATKDGVSYPFRASMTIGQNRLAPPTNPATPGANPICKQRIVSPIALSIRPEPGGDLSLRVDPAQWFDSVDFAALTLGDNDPGTFEIADTNDNPAGRALFGGVTAASATTYRFAWFTP